MMRGAYIYMGMKAIDTITSRALEATLDGCRSVPVLGFLVSATRLSSN
jgi:hypothetical protein